jgi:hypothetical protein
MLFEVLLPTAKIFKKRQSQTETWNVIVDGDDKIVLNRSNFLSFLEKIESKAYVYKQNIIIGQEEIQHEKPLSQAEVEEAKNK